jgi:hypothetical protein
MQKNEFLIQFLMFLLIIITFLITIHQISRLMPILKTCDDDFSLINRCRCIPCSWKEALKYDKSNCIFLNNITTNEK